MAQSAYESEIEHLYNVDSRISISDDLDDLLEYDESRSSDGLKRRLGFWDGTAILISIIIGSGIFSSPGETLDRSGSPGGALLAWIVSGLLVITASFCYAELGAMMPSTGGDFDYLKRAYGESTAFAFAWFYFWISKTGSLAIISTVFGNYIVNLFNGLNNDDDDNANDELTSKAIAVGLIIILTGLNFLGVKESSGVVNFLTVLKIGLVVTVCLVGVYFVSKRQDILRENFGSSDAFKGTSTVGMMTALIPCLWAYDGWANLNYLAEEMVRFEERLPKAILTAVLTVMACYVTVNVAYLAVLSEHDVVDSNAIAVDFAQAVSSKNILAAFFSVGVAVCAAGSAHGSMMTGGRAFYAVARHGMAPSIMARLNRKGSPYVSLLAQTIWTLCLLMLPGSSFSSLLDYTGPASWLFYALTGSTVIVLRTREPNARRPFKCPWYPLPPLLLCGMSLMLIVTSVWRSPIFCSLALGLVFLAIPVWRVRMWYVDRYVHPTESGDLQSVFESLLRKSGNAAQESSNIS